MRISFKYLALLALSATACNNSTHRHITLGEGTQYTNNSDSPNEVKLPDSSLVTLKPGSRLSIAKGFNKDNRSLELDGEATFDIKSNAGKPLVLHTRDLEITVLGTWFHVDAFRKNAGEQVDLLEGKLLVKKSYHSDTDNEPETLDAGDMVMINRDIDLMEKEKMNPDELKKLKAMR